MPPPDAAPRRRCGSFAASRGGLGARRLDAREEREQRRALARSGRRFELRAARAQRDAPPGLEPGERLGSGARDAPLEAVAAGRAELELHQDLALLVAGAASHQQTARARRRAPVNAARGIADLAIAQAVGHVAG